MNRDLIELYEPILRARSPELPLPPFTLSVEVFPPRTPEATVAFWQELGEMREVAPAFVSITCGAGGTGRDGTFPLALEVRRRLGLEVAAHLTCAGHSRAEVDALAEAYWQNGIRRLVALRGDPPRGSGPYRPRPDGYAYAVDLVRGLKAIAPFDISVAGYPETHPEAPDPEFDLDNVRRKVEAGASRVIGQYCFDTDRILRYRDALIARGVSVPFVPGIMPIHSFAQIARFSARCGAAIPDWLARMFEGVPEGSTLHTMLAASVVAEQVRRLVREGFRHFHVYALNRAAPTRAICRLLDLPAVREAAA
ncbi:5,10-methylenetetrahydrofolate reductase [bacterium HR40]|nr:5,10-methylenetetrahydrofolate reductase [bacterium HR40]